MTLYVCISSLGHIIIITSVKIIKNEEGCRDDTVPKTVETRRESETMAYAPETSRIIDSDPNSI